MKSKLHPVPARLAWVALFAAAALAHAAPAAAQTTSADSAVARSRPPVQADPAREDDGPLLDAPVSRTEYLLGPGDRLGVAVVGEFNEVYTVTVTPEGSVLLPGIGITRVLGLNLEQAQDRIGTLVARFYRNVEVRVALTRVRVFNVFLAGDVENPGVRKASAATRASEVVGGIAGGVLRRGIVVRRANGDSLTVDMVRFLRAGDTGANPFLREGDAVIVPPLNRWVNVYGRVHFTGTYEYRDGETLGSLLASAGGYTPEAADTTLVVRTVNGEHRVYRLSRNDPALATFPVRPFDAVYVVGVGNFNVQPIALVQGEVLRPGVYPIRPDTTTVRELVAMAGGFTGRASLSQAVLDRRVTAVALADTTAAADQDPNSAEQRTRRAFNSEGTSRVVVDFERLFGPGGERFDQPVRDGDRLTVPERGADVSVRGAVATPGLVPFQEGMRAEHYIALAGWYSRRADVRNVVVVRARTGARLTPREVGTLQPGDVIVVPYREPRPWNDILTRGQLVVTTITSLVITAIAIIGRN
ncbi:MAG TPA: SLBB domain-containing protein [Longimicrobium sp.]|nr:SLBB domain-containing protein [Longimicrobium sp.]